MVKCGKCGFEDEGNFCSNCGATLTAPDETNLSIDEKIISDNEFSLLLREMVNLLKEQLLIQRAGGNYIEILIEKCDRVLIVDEKNNEKLISRVNELFASANGQFNVSLNIEAIRLDTINGFYLTFYPALLKIMKHGLKVIVDKFIRIRKSNTNNLINEQVDKILRQCESMKEVNDFTEFMEEFNMLNILVVRFNEVAYS